MMAALVSSEQLNSFLEKLDILCDKLKVEDCPVCDTRLTENKITCDNGHGICPSCKRVVNVCPLCAASFCRNDGASFPVPPKRSREDDGETMTVEGNVNNSNDNLKKCPNRGCQSSFPISDMLDEHLVSCFFRPYTCKICHVEISLPKLRSHCEKSHSNQIIKNSTFKSVTLEPQKGDSNYYFISIHDEIFWFWRNTTDRLVYFGLQYCGDAERIKEFTYTLEVVGKDQKTSLKFTGPVLFDTAEMPMYSPSDDYAMIGRNLIGIESIFKITVHKV